jgi:cytochrome c2
MTLVGLGDPAERADLIAYLARPRAGPGKE